MKKTDRQKLIKLYIDGDENSFSEELIDIKFEFNKTGLEKIKLGNADLANVNELYSLLKINYESLRNYIIPLIIPFVKYSKIFDININFHLYPIVKDKISAFVSFNHKKKDICDLVAFDLKEIKNFNTLFEEIISFLSDLESINIQSCIFTYQKDFKKIKHKKCEIFYKNDLVSSFFFNHKELLNFSSFWIDVLINKDIEYLFRIKADNELFEAISKKLPSNENEIIKIFCDMGFIKVPHENTIDCDIKEILEMNRLLGY